MYETCRGCMKKRLLFFEKAVKLRPDYASAWNNLGDVQLTLGYTENAMSSFKRAIELTPLLLPAYVNQAKIHLLNGDIEAAVNCYDSAITRAPNNPLPYFEKGRGLLDIGRPTEARLHFEKARTIAPDYPGLLRQLALLYYYQGDHGKLREVYNAVAVSDTGNNLDNRLLLSELSDIISDVDPVEACVVHRKWAELMEAGVEKLCACNNDSDPCRRLKIGYVSGDFRKHSVSFFIEPVLSCHDRTHFKIYCYSNHYVEDEVTERLKHNDVEWRSIYKVDPDCSAKIINDDGIDILIDLSGRSEHNALTVFARHPAPVQVTWLGGLGTTGMSSIKYRIVDNYTDPVGMSEEHHTETLWRMPNSFLVYRPLQNAPEISSLPAFENGYITFGSFNNFSKITLQVIELWAQLLSVVPTARLLLKANGLDEPEQQQRVRFAFEAYGIVPERILLFGKDATYQEHLRQYNKVDIALDPFPWNGGTTTCEALWMGVPVITLAGNRFLSRIGVSILNNTGLSGWIAQTPGEYIVLAKNWSHDLQTLAQIRAGLRGLVMASPLVNATAFTADLEKAYNEMWATWCTKG